MYTIIAPFNIAHAANIEIALFFFFNILDQNIEVVIMIIKTFLKIPEHD